MTGIWDFVARPKAAFLFCNEFPVESTTSQEIIMIAASNPFRRIIQILAAAGILVLSQAALAQCAGIHEEGRWRNLDNKGEPSYIDVKMLGGCGDTAPNGVQEGTSVRYTMRVWVRQSTGKFYGRPTVTAAYRPWKGQKWLQG